MGPDGSLEFNILTFETFKQSTEEFHLWNERNNSVQGLVLHRYLRRFVSFCSFYENAKSQSHLFAQTRIITSPGGLRDAILH